MTGITPAGLATLVFLVFITVFIFIYSKSPGNHEEFDAATDLQQANANTAAYNAAYTNNGRPTIQSALSALNAAYLVQNKAYLDNLKYITERDQNRFIYKMYQRPY